MSDQDVATGRVGPGGKGSGSGDDAQTFGGVVEPARWIAVRIVPRCTFAVLGMHRAGLGWAWSVAIVAGLMGSLLIVGWRRKLVVTDGEVVVERVFGRVRVPRSEPAAIVVDRKNRTFLVRETPLDLSVAEVRRVTKTALRLPVDATDEVVEALGLPALRAERIRFGGCFGLTFMGLLVLLAALIIGIVVTEIW